jgi:hypothetical protein
MKTLAWILLPLALCAPGPALEIDGPEIDGLIDSARSAPAEFASDALIRIAALDKLEKPRRIELLEQAFQRASGAQQPYKRRAAITRFGGPAGFLNRVNSQGLDAMSLRLRSIEAMLPLDARKARDLLLQIPPLNLTPATCEENQIYDPAGFYQVLGAIASGAFTEKEIQQQAALRLVERHIVGIVSPVQVAPAAKMLAGMGWNDADFQSAVTAFAGALRKIGADDRSFAASLAAGRQIEELVEQCKRRKMPSLLLVDAYRAYLVNHLSAVRCADSDLLQVSTAAPGPVDARAADVEAADAANFFNQKLLAAPLRPLQESETTPSRVEGAATGLRGCEDAPCKAVMERFRALVFNPAGAAYQTSEKAAPEWRHKLADFLAEMTRWQESREATPLGYFRDKCGLYNDLAAAVATPDDRETVLRALLDFVQRNSFQADNRAAWFLPVNGLIGRVGLDPRGLPHLADELRRPADPVIALYANLEKLAPRSADLILPLL